MCLIAVGFATALPAQEATGAIRGILTDPSGARVARAQISAIHVETDVKRQVLSSEDGSYVLVLLPIGHYRLEAVARGFRRYVQDGISISLNQTANVPIEFAVGAEQEIVEVRADALMVQTTNDLGETVYQRNILDLPLNGRNFTQLGLLQPGVAPLPEGLQQAGGALRAGQSYSVNGLRPESNQFLIDGAENFNTAYGGFALKPPVDSIAEFRILTNTASAEFGHSAGSNTNIVTRSGSNQLHGSAYEFLRNNALDARNFFATTVEPLKQNQFGATLGGPIRHDRTFFFGYYEGFRNRQGETQSATVPSTFERQGDFSHTVDPSTGQVLPLINYMTGQPYPDNRLPSLSPIAQKLLNFYPLANSGTNLFTATEAASNNNDQFGTRIDHYFSPHDSVFARYMFSNSSQVDPLSVAGANVPGFPVGENDRAQNAAIEETHSFSPSLVNVVRISFMRYKLLVAQGLNHTLPSSLGFAYQPTLGVAAGPPFIQVPGYADIGDPITGPRNTYQTTYSFSDSLSWIHGRHQINIGADFHFDQLNIAQGIATNGFFVFTSFPISNAMASFLSGTPVFFIQGGGDLPRGMRAKAFSAFAEDSLRISPRLTINIGLRYELPLPYTEVKNRLFLVEPGVQSKVHPDAPAGLVYPGDPGVPGGLIRPNYHALAPRIGLAWDPTGTGRWSIRSAYGVFYDPYYTGQGGPLQSPISAPPWVRILQIGSPDFANPTAGLNPTGIGYTTPFLLLTLDPRLRLPYAQDWNLTVERAFAGNWILRAGYVGTKGTKLPRLVEGNPAVYVPGQSTEDNANQRRIFSGCTLASPDNCIFSSTGLISGVSNSTYHSLQASVRRRLSLGVSLLASYTFSKSLDGVSTFNITGGASQDTAGENDLAQNPFNLAAEHGRSLFDARHRFVLSYQWELPFWRRGNGWYRYAFGNWQLNGIFSASTGTPFTVYDSTDVSLGGSAPEISSFPSNRPNLVGDPNQGPRSADQWMNIHAFQRLDPVADAGQYGSEGRNVVQGPGLTTWDFSLFKDFRLTESKTLQFRAESFNFLNHTNFGLPNNDVSSPDFGHIKRAYSPRLMQFALKLIF
ncbi:MAG: carboxypeptidase regulatory-like domain-containing protein [Bryobacteraceae bacterium]